MREIKPGILDAPESGEFWEMALKNGELPMHGGDLAILTIMHELTKDGELFLPFFFWQNLDNGEFNKAVTSEDREIVLKSATEFAKGISLGQLIRVDLPVTPGGSVMLLFMGEAHKGDETLSDLIQVITSPKFASVKALVKKAMAGEVVKIKTFTKDTITYQY